jgi:hypothetical protein
MACTKLGHNFDLALDETWHQDNTEKQESVDLLILGEVMNILKMVYVYAQNCKTH